MSNKQWTMRDKYWTMSYANEQWTMTMNNEQ